MINMIAVIDAGNIKKQSKWGKMTKMGFALS